MPEADLGVVWGKSLHDPQTRQLVAWLPVGQHLLDTEGVAGRLVDEWVSPQVLRRIAEDVPGGSAGVRTVVRWLAGIHDIGKCSPAFVVQVDRLADRMRNHGWDLRTDAAADPARSAVRHELVGHVAVREWLVDRLGFDRLAAGRVACVVGAHHGMAPEYSRLNLAADHSRLAGDGQWKHGRERLLDEAAQRCGGIEALRPLLVARWSKPTQVLLCGIVIVADWIASSLDLFPLIDIEQDRMPPVDQVARRQAGWSRLRLPVRWAAAALGDDLDAAFRRRFQKPTVRPLQVAAAEAARHAPGTPATGILVVEAPMGSGKTEAALLAVEELAAQSGADGCFIALPTRATADAMFSRAHQWLAALPGSGRHSVTLAHGTASLNDEYRGLMAGDRYASIGEDDESLVAHWWLRGRKRGALASFVIGTIDQVLFAGLKAKHLMLRHLALAGKVVVLDEVHAYDVYMSVYLDLVLKWLGAYRVPVVLLSATLPSARRAELLTAYQHGRGAEPPAARTAAYPAVTTPAATRAVPADPDRTVHLDHLPDDDATLVAYLRDRLADGGCAAVVRNTVGRVQAAADILIEEFGQENVTIAHSRFLACDRAAIDQDLLRRFGHNGDRPGRHIVVASQVIEQSLDVDFDLLVTDLAPADLVLQRIGRLHRHDRQRPAPLEVARCALVGVEDWATSPPHAVAGSRAVYGQHMLLRAAALLGPQARTSIQVPSQIPDIVEAAYADTALGPLAWQPAMREAARTQEQRTTRRQQAAMAFRLGVPTGDHLIGWQRGNAGNVDDTPKGVAQVRDSGESIEVLVVTSDGDDRLFLPPWIPEIGGRQLENTGKINTATARAVAATSLRLPRTLCIEPLIDDVIAALETNRFDSFQATPLLADQLVLVLDTGGKARLRHGNADFHLTYDRYRGLSYERA